MAQPAPESPTAGVERGMTSPALLRKEFGTVAVLVAVKRASSGQDFGTPFPALLFTAHPTNTTLRDEGVTLLTLRVTPVRHVVTPSREDVFARHDKAATAKRRRIVPNAARPVAHILIPGLIHPTPHLPSQVEIVTGSVGFRLPKLFQGSRAGLRIARVELLPSEERRLRARGVRFLPFCPRLNTRPVPMRTLKIKKIGLGNRHQGWLQGLRASPLNIDQQKKG